MALSAHAAVSLSEVKAYLPIVGTGKDSLLESEASRWTREVESYLDRRLVFRAPTEDDDAILAAEAWANGNPTVDGQPASPGRTLVVTFPSTATAGTITITGTVAGVAGVTEAFDVTTGPLVQYGVKFFTAVSAITIAGATGSGNVKVGTSLGYVEYHTPPCYTSDLWLLEWPVRQVLTVHEDANRAYGSDTLLVAGTDYDLAEMVRLVRLSSLLPHRWAAGYRTTKGVYSAGYFTLASVPGELKSIILELIAWSFRYSQSGQQGMASGSDVTGAFVLAGPPMLTSGMKDRLSPFRRPSGFGGRPTGERDFDLEAA